MRSQIHRSLRWCCGWWCGRRWRLRWRAVPSCPAAQFCGVSAVAEPRAVESGLRHPILALVDRAPAAAAETLLGEVAADLGARVILAHQHVVIFLALALVLELPPGGVAPDTTSGHRVAPRVVLLQQ